MVLDLAPYVRAGSVGPDGYPDFLWGQLAAHVDHRNNPPAALFPGGFDRRDADLRACWAELPVLPAPCIAGHLCDAGCPVICEGRCLAEPLSSCVQRCRRDPDCNEAWCYDEGQCMHRCGGDDRCEEGCDGIEAHVGCVLDCLPSCEDDCDDLAFCEAPCAAFCEGWCQIEPRASCLRRCGGREECGEWCSNEDLSFARCLPDCQASCSESYGDALTLCAGRTQDVLRALFGRDWDKGLKPLTGRPQWRSIEWGHEVLGQALALHGGTLDTLPLAELLDRLDRPPIDLPACEDWEDCRDDMLAILQDHRVVCDPDDLRCIWSEFADLQDESRQDYLVVQRYAERAASIAFALGYLTHLAGDGFAHTWVNEYTGQPFDWEHGRTKDVTVEVDGQQVPLGPGVAALFEELQHIGLEAYVDRMYAPSAVGLVCEPPGAGEVPPDESLCQAAGGAPFPLPCEYCNPLRNPALPPDVPLSPECDHCFEECNPWRKVCPPRLRPGHPCEAECPQQLKDCPRERDPVEVARECGTEASDCVFAGLVECADLSTQCLCERVTQAYVDADILPDDAEVEAAAGQAVDADGDGEIDFVVPEELLQAADLTCENAAGQAGTDWMQLMQQWDILRGEMNRVFEEHGLDPDLVAPCGCYQGPITYVGREAEAVLIEHDGREYEAAEAEVLIDLNDDGRHDVINECMWMNCILSPGRCPYRALAADVPHAELAGSLVCEPRTPEDVRDDPDVQAAFLADTRLAIPPNFYRKVFMERRFGHRTLPDRLQRYQGLGAWSLGGYGVNGTYVMMDALDQLADILQTLRRPIHALWVECVTGATPACDLAQDFALVEAYLVVLAATAVTLTLTLVPVLLVLAPTVGAALAWALSAVAISAVTLVFWINHGMLPGLARPLQAKRERLAELLDRDWVTNAHRTAQDLAGDECPCGSGTCPSHRILGLSYYADWAEEVFAEVEHLDCDDSFWITRLIDGGALTPDEELELVLTLGLLEVEQWLSCKLAEYFYDEKVAPTLREVIGEQILETVVPAVCDFVRPYADLVRPDADAAEGPDVDGQMPWLHDCVDAMKAFYMEDIQGEEGPEAEADLGVMLSSVARLLRALDRDDDEAVRIVVWIVRQKGYDVSGLLDGLADIDEVLDEVGQCGPPVAVGVERLSPGDILRDLFPPGVLGEDRVLGVERDLVPAGSAKDELVIEHFGPLYNTIQLSKLALLGTGESCKTLTAGCRNGRFGEALCDTLRSACKAGEHAKWQGNLRELGLPGIAGIRQLVELGNQVPVSEDDPDLYAWEPLDEDPETYLESFFAGQTAMPGHTPGDRRWSCEPLEYNLMCNALYSLDDPDDYCRDLQRWVEQEGVRAAPGPHLECGTALSGLDDTADISGWPRYQPDARRRSVPGGEPDPRELPSGEQALRSIALDRVVRQWSFSEVESYHPYDLTAFALASSDEQVTRLHRNVFSPWYCPASGPDRRGWQQPDRDCDTVPDACDLCPETWNPDQRDQDLDGLGDDCILDAWTGDESPADGSESDRECRPELAVSCADLCFEPEVGPSRCSCDPTCDWFDDVECCPDVLDVCSVWTPIQDFVEVRRSCQGRCGERARIIGQCSCDCDCRLRGNKTATGGCCDDMLRACPFECVPRWMERLIEIPDESPPPYPPPPW